MTHSRVRRRKRRRGAERQPDVAERVTPAPEAPTPARGAPLAMLIHELHRTQHRAALADHLAGRIYADYLGEDAAPRFMVTIGDGPPVQADSDAVIELAGMLATTADAARQRVSEILALELPGGGEARAEDGPSDNAQFEARVVEIAAFASSRAARR